MRTITLELLRHGPAHNQLLSPLTPYLALCENHGAVTLQIKLEHNQLLHRLRALSYRLGEEARSFQLQDTARLLAELLASIPGLAADLHRCGVLPGEANAPLHLRLVLSASELALLPFELALSPPAWPGAGQPMLLQQQTPMCLTRETRRFAENTLTWPKETRVLMVTASPAGLPPPPDLAHLLALRHQLEAWIGGSAKVAQHLTVLANATLADVAAACAAQDFTHVHILAHGGEHTDGYDTRFGLMLHDAANPQGPADIVSGERLGSALRAQRRGGGASGGGASCPTVVTLASCNSGAVGSVAGVGGSIAHALHQAGIPMVIASQFPLSFGGSVRMVETLYEGLLWGEDPRALLVTLRQQLHTQFPETNDWASITAYSSLPADFERQLDAAQIQRAMSAINVTLDTAEALVGRLPKIDLNAPARAMAPDAPSGTPTAEAQAAAQAVLDANAAIDAALGRVQDAKGRLKAVMARRSDQKARVLGLLASTEKREAEFSHQRGLRSGDAGERAGHAQAMWASLSRASKLYFDCYSVARTPYFTTQYLSLNLVLQMGGKLPQLGEQPGRATDKLWDLAEVQALHDLQSTDTNERIWALGNLIELYLLAPAIPGVAERPVAWVQRASDTARQLLETSADCAFEVFSTRRQISRYVGWYAQITARGQAWRPQVLQAAKSIQDLLPAQAQGAWDYANG